MRITSALPAMPLLSAIHPAWRPISSTTITRSWLSAVECSLSMASVAVATAVSKPKVTTVPATSLSIVLGTPTTLIPFCQRSCPILSEPSPPMVMSASNPLARNAATRSSERSTSRIVPSAARSAQRNGLPRLVVPRMVPPRWVMPRTRSGSSFTTAASWGRSSPSKPRSMPYVCHPRWWAESTTARITALRPGASPPPVEMARRTDAWGVGEGRAQPPSAARARDTTSPGPA